MRETGKITVITGNGKGKTTSAIGIMMQAAAKGKKVYFGQFMKDGEYSEIKMLRDAFPSIVIDQYAGKFVLKRAAKDDDHARAQYGIERATEALESNDYDLVVLDEINIVLFLETVTLEQVMGLIDIRGSADLVLTGRYADPAVIERADEAIEILQIKHYFNEGVPARVGIEM